ncbi:MAG: phage/plasmid primase, P4 family [Chloroflexota bacterium]|nr:phage/plasmid primase, P4 family [Chloroflexota bacterium]
MSALLSAARQYHAWGANVTAIRRGGKGPLHEWTTLQTSRQTAEQFAQLPWHQAAGVGVINGINGWHTLELDARKEADGTPGTPISEATLLCVLAALGLPDDYPWVWRSGSGTGWEIAVRCDEPMIADALPAAKKETGVFWGWAPDGADFEHAELRWEHNQTIYPPSAYTYGKGKRKGQAGPGYRWRTQPPTVPPTLVPVRRVIHAFLTLCPPPPHTLGSIDDATKARIHESFDLVAYAQQAFGGEVERSRDEVRITGQGGLLINPSKHIWHLFSEGVGGDCFDLVAYATYGTTVKNMNGKTPEILAAAADFAGVVLPERAPVDGKPTVAAGTKTAEAGSPKLDASHAAARFAEHHGNDWAYDEAADLWYIWQRTHYEAQTAKQPVALVDALKAALHDTGIAASTRTIGDARLFARSLVPSLPAPRAGLVNFLNGTLDTATMELRPHSHADGFTYCLPFAYSASDYPQIAAFLTATIPDPMAQRAYMAHIGLALLGDVLLHKAVLLLGPPRSGKSTALMLANAVCGNAPEANAGPALFNAELEGMRSRAVWNGKRIVTIEELPTEALRNEEIFKAMTAHGGVAARRMNVLETLNNRWTSKLLMATNEAPRYADRSGALTQRLIVIRCPNGRIEEQLDVHLFERLMPELGAFAAACITEARKVRTAGRYDQSPAMLAELAAIETDGDAVKSFVLDMCVIDADAWIPSASLYRAYLQYCEENGHTRPMVAARLGRAVTERYRSVEPKSRKVDGKPIRGLQGIRLRTDHDLDPFEDSGIRQDTAGIRQPELTVYPEIAHPNAVNQDRYTADTVTSQERVIDQQLTTPPSAESINVNAHRNAVSAVYRNPTDDQNEASQSRKTRYTATLPAAVSLPPTSARQGGILHQVRQAIRDHRLADAEQLMRSYPDLADWSYEREEIARVQKGHAA